MDGLSHCPDTDQPAYQPDEVTARCLDQMNGEAFYINEGDFFVGIFLMDISAEALMVVIDLIG